MEEKRFDISGFGLHVLAMALMLLDHLWATVVPGNTWMTCAGRLAFPIFAFLLAEGFVHTRSVKGYALRLLFWAVVSEIPFDLMYASTAFFPFHQNVLWTFLLALLCMWVIDAVGRRGRKWLTAAAALAMAAGGWLLGTLLMTDYFGGGVLTVLVFYLFRGDGRRQRLGQFLCLAWINCSLLAGWELAVPGLGLAIPQQSFALLALIPIWLYRGRQGPHGRAVRTACYAFYPVHMLLLALLVRLF